MIRVAPDGDLILDLDSVVVNGQRYAIRADVNRLDAPERSSNDGRTGEFPEEARSWGRSSAPLPAGERASIFD
jgi:hypothetical protein